MADGVTFQSDAPATPAAGVEVATDDAGAAGHVQVVKLAVPTDGSATAWGDATDGLPVEVTNASLAVTGSLSVGSTVVRKQVTPTISTSAYAAKDNVGALMEFTNAADSSGGSVRVVRVQIADKAQQRADLDLVLLDRSITTPTDNAVFDPTDTEIGYIVGVVPASTGAYADFNDNSALDLQSSVTAKLDGTSLFGVLVARSTPTYASTSDLVVTLTIEQL